eukprot:jgi/Undpi1/1901/HiC_scaffold_12.g05288.m1
MRMRIVLEVRIVWEVWIVWEAGGDAIADAEMLWMLRMLRMQMPRINRCGCRHGFWMRISDADADADVSDFAMRMRVSRVLDADFS